jgi:hypothetical protein
MDFDRIANQLSALTGWAVDARVRWLCEHCTAVVAQIRTDGSLSGPLPFWGRSVNFDEHENIQIVAPAILETLAAAADRNTSLTTPNAGLQHTYGYLLSTIQTRYGKKRKRWIEDTLELAFDQPRETFGPFPEDGTLLSNVTWLAGHFAFRNEARLQQMQSRLHSRVAKSLHRINWPQIHFMRLTEPVRLMVRGTSCSIALRTDLFRMPSQSGTTIDGVLRRSNRPRTADADPANPYLLVYSVLDSRDSAPRLITLFTIDESHYADLIARANQRNRTDIRPRFNAYVSGFTEPRRGTCTLTRMTNSPLQNRK